MAEPPFNPAEALILLKGATAGAVRQPARPVAVDVNWEVRAGDYWVIGGLQGAGKTDLLMMAAGLMPPLRGTYQFLGERMPIFEEGRLAHRLRLGLVFDTGQLFNHLTVAENIALPLRYHQNLSAGEAAAQVRELLEWCGLESRADTTPGTLGRNWAKRAGLARALVLKPEVLLLDAPISGLDLRQTHWWLDFLGQLHRGHPFLGGRPMTLVATASDLRPWKGRARQFAVLRDDRLVVLGDWAQLEAASRDLARELWAAEAGGD